MSEIIGLLPFIPGGSDFQRSRELFKDIGFEELWVNQGYVGFKGGQAKFILQDFNEPSFANNLMIRLDVNNLEEWWEKIKNKKLADKYPEFKIKPPTQFPWGREVHFIDLAGVCWHVGEV